MQGFLKGYPGDGGACADLVRRHDRGRFLCALFAPADGREALFALYAFNLEIARVRERVSEAVLGEIRLQWWREAIAAAYAGAPPRHEVALALGRVLSRLPLSRAHFDRLLDCRALDLNNAPFADSAALTAYAEGTSAALTALALEALGAAGDPAADRAGRHVGIGFALAGLLRAVPFHARMGRVCLPKSLLEREGVAVEDILETAKGGVPRPAASSRLAAVVQELSGIASEHLDAARGLRREVPKEALPALLPATLAASDLARLARRGHDVFAAPETAPAFLDPVRLFANALRGRY